MTTAFRTLGSWHEYAHGGLYSPDATIRSHLADRIPYYKLDSIRAEYIDAVDTYLVKHGILFSAGRFHLDPDADLDADGAADIIRAAIDDPDIDAIAEHHPRYVDNAFDRLQDASNTVLGAAEAFKLIPMGTLIPSMDVPLHLSLIGAIASAMEMIAQRIDTATGREHPEVHDIAIALLDAARMASFAAARLERKTS